MIARISRLFIKGGRCCIDSYAGWGTGDMQMLGWLVEDKAIEPHVPGWDKTERCDGTFSSNDFQWTEQPNEYRCPMAMR
ncbi:MAG: hypothetical protein ACLPXB_04050 [Thiobacillaceae bacterium]